MIQPLPTFTNTTHHQSTNEHLHTQSNHRTTKIHTNKPHQHYKSHQNHPSKTTQSQLHQNPIHQTNTQKPNTFTNTTHHQSTNEHLHTQSNHRTTKPTKQASSKPNEANQLFSQIQDLQRDQRTTTIHPLIKVLKNIAIQGLTKDQTSLRTQLLTTLSQTRKGSLPIGMVPILLQIHTLFKSNQEQIKQQVFDMVLLRCPVLQLIQHLANLSIATHSPIAELISYAKGPFDRHSSADSRTVALKVALMQYCRQATPSAELLKWLKNFIKENEKSPATINRFLKVLLEQSHFNLNSQVKSIFKGALLGKDVPLPISTLTVGYYFNSNHQHSPIFLQQLMTHIFEDPKRFTDLEERWPTMALQLLHYMTHRLGAQDHSKIELTQVPKSIRSLLIDRGFIQLMRPQSKKSS